MRFARGFYVAAEAEAATHKAIERHTSAGSETSKEPALRKGLWVNPGGIHERARRYEKRGDERIRLAGGIAPVQQQVPD